LCPECEDLFEREESFVLAHADRGSGGFTLRTRLLSSPAVRLPNREVAVHDLELAFPDAAPRLTYFAASIFWRAAATKWRSGNGRVQSIDLGPYLEDFRLYLLGKAEFPPNAALVVFLDSRPHAEPLGAFPYSKSRRLYHLHGFAIPGIRFVLMVGGMISAAHRKLAINSVGPKPVYVEDFEHTPFFDGVLDLLKSSRPVGKLRPKP
jgi:hypothetical protein